MSSPGYWQTGCLWWEAVESWFHLDLKSFFALKNNSMGFLLGHITRWINIYGSRMKWTWHHSQVRFSWGKFPPQTQSGTPSSIIYTRWSSWHDELGCQSPMVTNTRAPFSKTPVTPGWRPHGLQEKLRTPRCEQWDLLDRRGIAVASPLDAVGSPRTPCHGAHFVHAQSARRGSAFPRRSEWAPWERLGFAAATQ